MSSLRLLRKSVPVVSVAVYYDVISHPLGAFFKLDLPGNQEGANTETVRVGKALGEMFPNADFFGTDISNCGDINHGRWTQGCVTYAPSYALCSLSTPFLDPGTRADMTS